ALSVTSPSPAVASGPFVVGGAKLDRLGSLSLSTPVAPSCAATGDAASSNAPVNVNSLETAPLMPCLEAQGDGNFKAQYRTAALSCRLRLRLPVGTSLH